MSDPLDLLRDRIAKAEAKLQRHEKAVESTRSEVADLHTTLRVMCSLTEGESTAPLAPQASLSARHSLILGLLREGQEGALPPVTIFELYKAIADDINPDTFRTTIWRMKDKFFTTDGWLVEVKSEDGKYWKESLAGNLARNETEAPTENLSDASAGGWEVPLPRPLEVKPNPWPGARESE